MEVIDGAGALVCLTGESVAARPWTPRRKAALRASRIGPTAALVAAMQRAAQPPSVFVSASGVGYYGHLGDQVVDEEHGPGHTFLANLCVDWEAAAAAAGDVTRVVIPRLGLVFGPNGGALPRMALPFRFLVGGPIGSGRQWLPWIDLDDAVGLLYFAIEHPEVRGPINLTAPAPARNWEVAAAIGLALGRPSWLAVPGPMLRLMLGEMAGEILGGARVVPSLALRLGYEFQQPDLDRSVRRALRANTSPTEC
jgi:hypothetical protein